VEFPAPQPVGKHERSIAERHRILVLLASVFNLLPIGIAVGLFVSNPPVRLLLTLGIAFALTYGLVQVLRRRFLNLVLSHELVLRPTLRNPGHHATSAVQELTSRGFSPVETVVVATDTGTTLTRPIVVMARHLDGHVAHANSIGATLMTLLDDGTWLVTSAAPVVYHPTLRIHRVDKRNTRAAVEQHTDQLRTLLESGVGAAAQPSALDTVIHFERLEQETLAAFRVKGVDAPSAKALTTSGPPGSL
jgi:hypothetical protein